MKYIVGGSFVIINIPLVTKKNKLKPKSSRAVRL